MQQSCNLLPYFLGDFFQSFSLAPCLSPLSNICLYTVCIIFVKLILPLLRIFIVVSYFKLYHRYYDILYKYDGNNNWLQYHTRRENCFSMKWLPCYCRQIPPTKKVAYLKSLIFFKFCFFENWKNALISEKNTLKISVYGLNFSFKPIKSKGMVIFANGSKNI